MSTPRNAIAKANVGWIMIAARRHWSRRSRPWRRRCGPGPADQDRRVGRDRRVEIDQRGVEIAGLRACGAADDVGSDVRWIERERVIEVGEGGRRVAAPEVGGAAVEIGVGEFAAAARRPLMTSVQAVTAATVVVSRQAYQVSWWRSARGR